MSGKRTEHSGRESPDKGERNRGRELLRGRGIRKVGGVWGTQTVVTGERERTRENDGKCRKG